MMRENIQRTDPKLLSKIFRAPQERDAWAHADVAAMVRHQLAAPLMVDLEAMFPGEGPQVAALAAAAKPAIVTFADLLSHASPPVELLRLVKDMAKAAVEMPQQPLPREV